MAAFLCPFFGAGLQLFTDDGVILAGGKLNFYLAGSSTPQDTWTTSAQSVLNANPVVLNAYGRIPNEIWLAEGVEYKCVVTTSADVPVGQTWDYLSGINDVATGGGGGGAQWEDPALTPTYISATSFSVVGDYTTTFQVGRRTKSTVSGGTAYSTISSSSFGGGVTTVVVVNDSTVLDAGISLVEIGLLTPIGPSVDASAVSYKTSVAPPTGSSSAVLQRADRALTLLTTGGSGTAYTLTPSPALAAYSTSAPLMVVKFHASASGTPTMNVSGLGVKSLKQIDTTGAKVAATVLAGQISKVVYDGTDLIATIPVIVAAATFPNRYLGLTAFTTSGTWTKGTDVGGVRVRAVGGGAGGQDYLSGTDTYFNGGGAGGYFEKYVSSPGSTVVVTIGTGGGTSANGGNTTFGTHGTASGGAVSASTTAGGVGGGASSGDVNLKGGDGASIDRPDRASPGGNSVFGGGGGTGDGADNTGGGGSGLGAGGSGLVIIEEYSAT